MSKPILPLPADTVSIFRKNREACDNAYLLFNRFLDGEWDRKSNNFFNTKNTQIQLYKNIQEINFGCSHHRERLKQILNRLEKSGFKTECIKLTTESRMVVGLGDENALEVGLSLHPLYGYPYIPGSSIKGLCRAWLEIAEDQFDDKSEPFTGKELENKISSESHSVFGSKSKSRQDDNNRLGKVTFFDAIPVNEPKFEVDIMNPHYSSYYSDPKKNPPGDWYSPVPIKFLTVAPGQSFLFALASREQESLEKAKKWLIRGLSELGIGAKTSSGYGYFVHPDEVKKRKEEIQRKEEATRPEWAVELEKKKSESVRQRETSPEERIKKLILEGEPSKDFYEAFKIWEDLNEGDTKKELAKLFFDTDSKYMKKKKKKQWYKVLENYIDN